MGRGRTGVALGGVVREGSRAGFHVPGGGVLLAEDSSPSTFWICVESSGLLSQVRASPCPPHPLAPCNLRAPLLDVEAVFVVANWTEITEARHPGLREISVDRSSGGRGLVSSSQDYSDTVLLLKILPLRVLNRP